MNFALASAKANVRLLALNYIKLLCTPHVLSCQLNFDGNYLNLFSIIA
jgi:hypothetical protein